MTKPTKPTEPENDTQKEAVQSILDFGSAMTATPHGNLYCLTIIGQIEGHMAADDRAKTTKYEHVLPLLAKLEESSEIAGVLFLLNTVGGDVEAGLAIAELIAGMTKPTVSIVLGGSHSIGVPLAVAARRSFAVPSAAMTISLRTGGGTLFTPYRLDQEPPASVGKQYTLSYRPGGPEDGFAPLEGPLSELAAAYRSYVYANYLSVPTGIQTLL